jgi:peroxiredoxin
MGGTGKVHFPVTSKDPRVEKFVEQGIGQLHGFWFAEAERSFREAARLDPNCGIAYWGMAIANQTLDPRRARQFADEAARRKAGLSDREQMYLAALTDEAGYQKIAAKYPADLEAKAFEVWRLWNKRERGDESDALANQANGLMQAILRAEPMHPIHHAMIHFADSQSRMQMALGSAAKCGPSAPSIGHMWHMPAHIYYPRKDYARAAWQLEASIRTENRHAIQDWASLSHLYGHNNEWLIRTLLRLGRVHEARQIALSMIDLPRQPDPAAARSGGESVDEAKTERLSETHATSANYGSDRLIQLLRDYEYWDELAELCRTGYLQPTGSPIEQAAFRANMAIVAYCRGDIAGGDRERATLQSALAEKIAQRQEHASSSTPTSSPSPKSSVVQAADSQLAIEISELRRQLEILEKHRKVLTAIYVNRPTLIVALLALAALDALGIWFFRRRFLVAALTAVVGIGAGVWIYERHVALLDLPYDGEEMDVAVVCKKLLDAGDPAEAVWSAENIAMERKGEVRPQANLVEMLYKAGKQDQARVEFEKLRELAAAADLDSPPLARLAPIAREFGFPADWRLREKMTKELAALPRLDSLGPLVWQPPAAPTWKLKDATGHEHSLNEFRGKPVVMVFFLGAGCAHCQSQLAALVKESARLAQAGWQVVAVSSDDAAAARKLLASYQPEAFPFLMLTDPELTVFRLYRAYDEFEGIALHGTFLIDPAGLVRWNDVGPEPFMDVSFLIGEFQRLLSRPAERTQSAGAIVVGASVASRSVP